VQYLRAHSSETISPFSVDKSTDLCMYTYIYIYTYINRYIYIYIYIYEKFNPPVVLNGCKIRSFILRRQYELEVFTNRVLRKDCDTKESDRKPDTTVKIRLHIMLRLNSELN
jgi:hypothetical protein